MPTKYIWIQTLICQSFTELKLMSLVTSSNSFSYLSKTRMPIMRTSVVSKNLYCTNGDGKNELKHYSTRQSHRHHLNNEIWWKRRRRSYNLSTDVQLFPFSLLVTKLHSNIWSRLESFLWKPHQSFSLFFFLATFMISELLLRFRTARHLNQTKAVKMFIRVFP